ncbi:MAG: 3-deoxy-7-phosphoheptulonate synthase [Candidatus Omnitrophota bacterium]
MSIEFIRPIPSTEEIFNEIPLNEECRKIKSARDAELKSVFEKKDPRMVLIVGPCSADNENAVCDYVNRLARVQDQVKDQVVLVPRIYTNKPRTTGEGYKGMAHQPDPNQDPNIVDGLKAIRRMHIRVIRESGLTAADEMLYPGNYPYLEDVLSYVAVGARSVENQEHRLTISGLDIPCGMKNPTCGDLTVMLNSINAAQIPHTFIYNGWEVKTSGNPLTHAIIRGAINAYGRCYPNYHYEDMVRLARMYEDSGLKNPCLIVDTNHANSNKQFKEQPRIAMEVMNSLEKSSTLRGLVRGFMIESYILEGRAERQHYGQSITDPCLGWDDTEKLINDIAEKCSHLPKL